MMSYLSFIYYVLFILIVHILPRMYMFLLKSYTIEEDWLGYFFQPLLSKHLPYVNIFLWSLRSPLRGGFTVYLKLWHCQEQHRAIMVATLFVGEYMYKRACWGAINKSLVTHADYSSTGFSAIRLWRGMIRLWWGMGITSVRQNTSARRTSPIFGTYVRRRLLKSSDTMAYILF